MTLTALVIVIPIVLWFVYTAIAKPVFGQKTISQAMRDASWKFNSAPFSVGVMAGHWFFPIRNPAHHAVGDVLPVILLVLVWDIAWAGQRGWFRYPGIWFALGVPAGALLWSQRLIGL